MSGAEQAERTDVLLHLRHGCLRVVEIYRDLLQAAGGTEFEDGTFASTILRRRNQRRERVEHERDQQKAADELAEAKRHGGKFMERGGLWSNGSGMIQYEK